MFYIYIITKNNKYMTLIDLYNYFDTHKEPKFFINNCFCWRANYNDVAFTPSRIGTRETICERI